MFKYITLAALAATVAAILGHYVLFGPKKVKGDTRRTVRRFSLWEQFIHFVTLGSFLTLAATGYLGVFSAEGRLHGWLWIAHFLAVPFFVFGLIAVTASWAKDGMFESHDWDWIKKFGGYLWGDKHAPAGRFNAGQKAYFWAVGLLGFACLISGLGRISPVFDVLGQEILYQVHRYTALLFVLAAVSHLYLGTLANPGSLGAMIYGRVSSKWAQSHHPQWWAQITGNAPADSENKKVG